MNNLQQLHLILYFSEGISLHDWVTSGIVDREVGQYLSLLPHVNKITFVTYGDGKSVV